MNLILWNLRLYKFIGIFVMKHAFWKTKYLTWIKIRINSFLKLRIVSFCTFLLLLLKMGVCAILLAAYFNFFTFLVFRYFKILNMQNIYLKLCEAPVCSWAWDWISFSADFHSESETVTWIRPPWRVQLTHLTHISCCLWNFGKRLNTVDYKRGEHSSPTADNMSHKL